MSAPHPLWAPRVEPLDLDRLSDRLRLLRAGLERYTGDSNHHAPLLRSELFALDRRRNPLLEDALLQAFVVVSGVRDAARLVVRARAGGPAVFSHFENDRGPAEAALLIDHARRWARSQGCTRLVGPVGVQPSDPAGVLTAGFVHPATVGTPHNPPEYGPQLEAAGLQPRWRIPAWRWELWDLDADQVADRIARCKATTGLCTRTASLAGAHAEIQTWTELIAGGCGEPWREDPPAGALAQALACDLPRASLPGLVVFAERHGRPCGGVVTVPDVNLLVPRTGLWGPLAWLRLVRRRASIQQGRVRYLVAQGAPQDDCVYRLLLLETALRAHRSGLRSLELSCGPEQDHRLVRLARELGARRTRTFTVYGADLGLTEECH